MPRETIADEEAFPRQYNNGGLTKREIFAFAYAIRGAEPKFAVMRADELIKALNEIVK